MANKELTNAEQAAAKEKAAEYARQDRLKLEAAQRSKAIVQGREGISVEGVVYSQGFRQDGELIEAGRKLGEKKDGEWVPDAKSGLTAGALKAAVMTGRARNSKPNS